MTNYNKNLVAYLLLAQLVLTCGVLLVQYAIIWFITLSTKSGVLTGLISAVFLISMISAMSFGGVLADKFNKKKILS